MKKILLTGGSGSIGNSIISELKKKYIILAPKRNELDLSNIQSVLSYKDCDIDILINCAGINNLEDIENISMENIQETFNVNLISPILLTKKVIPFMKRKRWGRIVNISSIFGVISKERRSIYTTSKSGIIGFTKTCAIELSHFGILTNTICPGYVNTEMTRKNNTKREIEKIKRQIPLGRFAKPEEIAKVVKFLISEENTYITGQTIICDGGFTCL